MPRSTLLDEVQFRPLDPDEMGFVMDSWFRSYRSSEWAGVIPNHLYYPTMREMLASLIARGAKILAAVSRGPTEDRVIGYVCYETKPTEAVVHYCYVKDPFRRLGLGGELWRLASGDSRSVLYTHKTRMSRYLAPHTARFVPEVARRKEP